MPLVTGSITEHGAVIDVLVGVSRNRQAVLEKHGLPVPKRIGLRVQLDTGSFITGLTSVVFQQLGIGPIGVVRVSTPSTKPGQPHHAQQFDIVLSLMAGMDQTPLAVRPIACDDFSRDRDGDVHGIIGRDVLDRCNLSYLGQARRFELAY